MRRERERHARERERCERGEEQHFFISYCREKKKKKKGIHALAYVVRNLYPTCTLLILMLVCINLLYVEAYYTVNLYIT